MTAEEKSADAQKRGSCGISKALTLCHVVSSSNCESVCRCPQFCGSNFNEMKISAILIADYKLPKPASSAPYDARANLIEVAQCGAAYETWSMRGAVRGNFGPAIFVELGGISREIIALLKRARASFITSVAFIPIFPLSFKLKKF
jgi:hypothetical protein